MTLMKITFNLEGCEEQVVAEESAACGFLRNRYEDHWNRLQLIYPVQVQLSCKRFLKLSSPKQALQLYILGTDQLIN
jgi:hypothetical protein